jgi:hypothetical protein
MQSSAAKMPSRSFEGELMRRRFNGNIRTRHALERELRKV